MPPTVRNEPKAGWALGIGIASVACCNLAGPAAIALGISAQRTIDASGGWLTGRGMATAGLVLGIIGIAFLVLSLLLTSAPFLLFPGG